MSVTQAAYGTRRYAGRTIGTQRPARGLRT
jgi:hypothetical protein